MPSKKVFHPQKQFEEHYAALAQLLSSRNFAASDIDFARCQKDIEEQGAERLALDALEGQYRQSHARFSVAQRERYERYSQLLNAARGIYRSDPGMLAALDKFRRRLERRSTEQEASGLKVA